jgi:hypothetical protein
MQPLAGFILACRTNGRLLHPLQHLLEVEAPLSGRRDSPKGLQELYDHRLRRHHHPQIIDTGLPLNSDQLCIRTNSCLMK